MIRKVCTSRLFTLSTLSAILLTLCGCTQNNGYLGPLFGSWTLLEITQNGSPVEPGDGTVFSFQNEIVSIIRYVDPPYTMVTKYGNFSHTGNELTLMFQSSPTPSGSNEYMPPGWLHFPKDETILPFEVRKLTRSEMVLVLDADGTLTSYSFKKTW